MAQNQTALLALWHFLMVVFLFSHSVWFFCSQFSPMALSQLEEDSVSMVGSYRSERGTHEYPGQLSQQHIIYFAQDTPLRKTPFAGNPENTEEGK